MAERLTPYLEASVLALPMEDRTYLLARLQSSLRIERQETAQERMAYLAEKMQETFGVDVLSRDQHTSVAWARFIFVYVSRREGFTQREVGDFLQRNHSTISYAEQRMRDAFALPDGYRDIINQYNDFIEAIL